MSNFEQLCNDYRENKRLIEELTALNEGLKADIIATMGDRDSVVEGSTKVTYKTVTSERLDAKRLKAALPDVYSQYCVSSQYKRFTVN